MNLTGKVDSAATAELVVAAVAGAAGTDHKDQVTDCKSILAIEARARAGTPPQVPPAGPTLQCKDNAAQD